MSGRAAGQHDDGQDAGVAFFLQELVIGITTGALYALMALSFTMLRGASSCSTSCRHRPPVRHFRNMGPPLIRLLGRYRRGAGPAGAAAGTPQHPGLELRPAGPAEQALFARLGVFADSFGLPAVEAVCDDDGHPAAAGPARAGQVTDTLGSLVDNSLVRTQTRASHGSSCWARSGSTRWTGCGTAGTGPRRTTGMPRITWPWPSRPTTSSRIPGS
jgi:hypothetical protein